MRKDLEHRLEALEEGDGPLIDDLGDMIKWNAAGCPSNWRWNLKFREQMQELDEKIKVWNEQRGQLAPTK